MTDQPSAAEREFAHLVQVVGQDAAAAMIRNMAEAYMLGVSRLPGRTADADDLITAGEAAQLARTSGGNAVRIMRKHGIGLKPHGRWMVLRSDWLRLIANGVRKT